MHNLRSNPTLSNAISFYALAGLLFFTVPCSALAERISIQLEGAQVPLHLDIEKGELYIGSDCSPFLFFKEVEARRSGVRQGRQFSVIRKQSRSMKRNSIAPRLPSAIVLKGDEVEVISNSIKGHSRAKGKVVPARSISSKSAATCKH